MKVVLFLLAMIGMMGSCQEGPDVPVEAEVGNMREVYNWLTIYKNNHKQSWPEPTGQAFLLELWRDGTIEKNEKNARRFFSAAEPYQDFLIRMGADFTAQTSVEYLNQLTDEFAFNLNYAAFDPQEDADVLQQLHDAPATVTILANATFAHQDVIYFMTGDGAVHKLNIKQLTEQGKLNEYDLNSGIVPVGRNSPVIELRTVTTN